MQILNLYRLKCIILHKLRHTWTFVVVVAKLIDSYYRKAINPQPQFTNNIHNNNNNNVMEQDLQDDLPEEQQQRQLAAEQAQALQDGLPEQQLDQAHGDFVARLQAFPAAVEPMDASDMENEDADAEVDEEIDIDDDDDDDDDDIDYGTDGEDSDPELEEMYSDADWTSSNDESEMSTTISTVALGPAPPVEPPPPRPIYTFQPARLIKCQFKEKHSAGGFPLARSGHRIIASKSHLYSLGGYNPRSALIAARRGRCLLFQELWSYNFATNRWKLELNADNASNMPTELASNALAIHNNVLIVSIWGEAKIDLSDCVCVNRCDSVWHCWLIPQHGETALGSVIRCDCDWRELSSSTANHIISLELSACVCVYV